MSDAVEKSVVGAILIDPETLGEVYEMIRSEMFSNLFYRSIFTELVQAYDMGKRLSLLELSQKIQSESFTQEFIAGKLKEIILDVNAYEIKSYANALVAEYKERRVNEILSRVKPAAGYIDSQINTLLQELEALKINDTVKIHTLGDVVDSVQGNYFTEPETAPLYTGFSRLDDTLGGLEKGDVIVVGARPAVGKSALVTQIALNLSQEGKRVAIYNLEMSDKQVYERMLSSISGIGLTRIRRARNFLGDEREKFDCK